MAADTPSFQMKVTSSNTVTSMLATISWTYKAKFEQDYVIASTDDPKTLPITDFSNIRLMVIYSDSANGGGTFDLSFTNTDGSPQTVVLGITDVFVMSLTEASLATLASLELSTQESNSITVGVRLYEEA